MAPVTPEPSSAPQRRRWTAASKALHLRVLIAGYIGTVFLTQICSLAAYVVGGQPSAPELIRACRSNGGNCVVADLTRIADFRGHRPVRLPARWLPSEGGNPPYLRVFIDGSPVPFHAVLSTAVEPPAAAWAYYRTPHTKTLRVVCGDATPCRNALLVREDAIFWPSVLGARVLGLPGTVLAGCVAASLLVAIGYRLLVGSRPTWRRWFILTVALAGPAMVQRLWWTRLLFRGVGAVGVLLLTPAAGALPWFAPPAFLPRVLLSLVSLLVALLIPLRGALLRLVSLLVQVLSSLRGLPSRMVPPSIRSPLLRIVVVAAFACALWRTVLPELHFMLGTDEGFYIHCAQRILRGEVPNRDFFSFIPPVSYAVLALVAWLHGAFAAADARLVVVACYLIAALIYAHVLSQGIGAPTWPLYAFSAGLGIWIETGPGSFFSFSHHPLSILFGALALLAFAPALRADRGVSSTETRTAGLAASLSVMTTTNFGLYLCLAVTVWLVIDGRSRPHGAHLVRSLVQFWLWFSSLPAVYLCCHLLLHNGGRLYDELVKFIIVNYASVNAGKLDYFFFFRFRLDAAMQHYVLSGSRIDLLLVVGSTVVLFLGHFSALALAAVALWRLRRAEGAERSFCRATLLLTGFYVASLSTSATDPFPSNINAHSLPAFVLLAAWALRRPMQAPLTRPPRGFHWVEAAGAAAAVAWLLLLPDWHRAKRVTFGTPLGDVTCANVRFCEDERQVLSLLEADPTRPGLVAYHYLAPRWYAYFPWAQRLEFSVLVPFYSPTAHYEEALAAMRRGLIRYAIEDRSLPSAWDPRVRFGDREKTNGGAFYRYVREHGRRVLSNPTFTVLELATPAAPQGRSADASGGDRGGLTPHPRHEF